MNEESTTLSGWWVFAGVLLLVAGVLNIIYGIAAIGDSKFFTENATYIISGLHTWGWVMLIIGVLTERDGGAALYPRLSVLVAGDLRPLDHHHLQAGRGPGGFRQLGEEPATRCD